MKVLENPDQISTVVLERGLDSGTGFEILSIDIADIDVGDNIARLQIDQAEAEKQVAQAKAERQRARCRPRAGDGRAGPGKPAKVAGEAEIPQAIAAAFRSGNLGIMDYYKLKNIDADTKMREAIAKDDEEDNNNGGISQPAMLIQRYWATALQSPPTCPPDCNGSRHARHHLPADRRCDRERKERQQRQEADEARRRQRCVDGSRPNVNAKPVAPCWTPCKRRLRRSWRSTSSSKNRPRAPVSRPKPAPAKQPPTAHRKRRARAGLLSSLHNPGTLKKAVVLKEVLDGPVALREPWNRSPANG